VLLRLNIGQSILRLVKLFDFSVDLMIFIGRVYGYTHLNQFNNDVLATFNAVLLKRTGIVFSGIDPNL